jgi:hypothetical protein
MKGGNEMVKKTNNLGLVGKWAFIIGLALAIIAGIIPSSIPNLALILIVLGLIVGFLNITEKDTVKLLVAIIALMAVGGITLAEIPVVQDYLVDILKNILIFASAAGLVVAIKAIYETGRA